jgi:predicted transcriptional regulator
MNLNKKQAEFAVVYINNPEMKIGQIAEEIGVHRNTISNWMQDKEFIEDLYSSYMKTFGAKLPSVLEAMYREAKNGNVQAGRLILEHSGKLIRNVEVKVESPFERFLQQGKQIEGAMIVEPEMEVQQPKEIAQTKQETLNQQKKESKLLISRAKKVGLKTLGRGRHTKTAKKNWLEKLEALESKSLPTE